MNTTLFCVHDVLIRHRNLSQPSLAKILILSRVTFKDFESICVLQPSLLNLWLGSVLYREQEPA